MYGAITALNLSSQTFLMDANGFVPQHPGLFVKNDIDQRNISQKDLARLIGMSPSTLSEVLSGKRPVTTEYALLFEAALGLGADSMLEMQTAYNKFMVSSNPRFAAKIDHVRMLAAGR